MDLTEIVSGLSLQEKERRWSLVRSMMRREGLGAIILHGHDTNELFCRYLTDMAIRASCHNMLLFPFEEDPLLLVTTRVQTYYAKRISWISPQNVYESSNLGADLGRHILALGLHKKRIGIASPGRWLMQDYQAFKDLCPQVETVEIGKALMSIVIPKSAEEIRLVENTVQIGELAQRTFISNLKPGMSQEQLVSKVEEVIRANGMERRFWLMSSSPDLAYPWVSGEAIMRKPDPVVFNAEFQRTQGYACQVVRTYCWEEPKGELKRLFELRDEMRRIVLKELRPGHQMSELGKKTEAVAAEWGFETDHFGHTMGLGFIGVGGVSISSSMEWTIGPNEVYVYHPMVRPKGGRGPLVWIGDMYLTGKEAPKWLTPYLTGLPEMIQG